MGVEDLPDNGGGNDLKVLALTGFLYSGELKIDGCHERLAAGTPTCSSSAVAAQSSTVRSSTNPARCACLSLTHAHRIRCCAPWY